MPYICDRCGFRYEKPLRREWTGLLVCDKDYDPLPPDHRPPVVTPEGLPRKDARPEPSYHFVEDNEITPEDL